MFVQIINTISVGGGGNGQGADNLLLPGQNRAGDGNDSKFMLFAVIGHSRLADGRQFRRQSCTVSVRIGGIGNKGLLIQCAILRSAPA